MVAALGECTQLKELDLRACPNLVFPPGHTHGDLGRIKRLLANTTRILANEISAADVDDGRRAQA